MNLSEDTLGSQRALILSPHPDDAALSVGGILHKRVFGSTTIVTVFGKTNYGYGWEPDWPNATSLRKAEDQSFAARLGVRLLYCEYPEAALRGRRRPRARFEPSQPRHHEVPPDVAEGVVELARREQPDVVLAPLCPESCSWYHADHWVTRSLAPSLARSCRAALAYYEDLPYCKAVPNAVPENAAAVCPSAVPLTINLGELLDAKLASLGVYDTQMRTNPRWRDAVRDYALLLEPSCGAERLWFDATTWNGKRTESAR